MVRPGRASVSRLKFAWVRFTLEEWAIVGSGRSTPLLDDVWRRTDRTTLFFQASPRQIAFYRRHARHDHRFEILRAACARALSVNNSVKGADDGRRSELSQVA